MEKTDKKPTKEEVEKAKGTWREIALKNLGESKLLDLATAYYSDIDRDYGEKDKSAVEEFLYNPALDSAKIYDPKTGEKSDLIKYILNGSRQDGKRYSGKVSEYDIIQTGSGIIRQSLGAVKVEDIMSLLGSSVNIKKDYKGKYISDLAQSKNKEDKEFAIFLIEGYMQYKTTQGVSMALGQRAEKIRGGLEELVKVEGK